VLILARLTGVSSLVVYDCQWMLLLSLTVYSHVWQLTQQYKLVNASCSCGPNMKFSKLSNIMNTNQSVKKCEMSTVSRMWMGGSLLVEFSGWLHRASVLSSTSLQSRCPLDSHASLALPQHSSYPSRSRIDRVWIITQTSLLHSQRPLALSHSRGYEQETHHEMR